MLFLSELETGREVVALGPRLDPDARAVARVADPVLDEVLDDDAQHAPPQRELERGIDVDSKLELPLRRRMLRVIVENLVENAIRYAGDGVRVQVGARRRDGQIVLRVADDGAGVAAEDLPRLFERFFRADRARASRGTGLGLAIVKHVVGAAGGSVEARGGLGRGLEIRCAFPAA